MSAPLVLSLFPGADLFGMAFEAEGFCVVQGPDIQFGRDVCDLHPPRGRFDGIIGGPPCQAFSPLAGICRARYGEASIAPNLIPEYERIVGEARPDWFVMENVQRAPMPNVDGYRVRDVLLNNRLFGSTQNRERRFSFGTPDGRTLSAGAIAASIGAIAGQWQSAACASVGGRRAKPITGTDGRPIGNQSKARLGLPNRALAEMCALQGLPSDFLEGAPFTVEGKRTLIGNGVPLPMGRAVARAVRAAMYPETAEVSA